MQVRTDRLLSNVRTADTLDLLDRATVFRDAMEAEAVEVIVAELARRGLGPDEIHAHGRLFQHRVLRDDRGIAASCNHCSRAATQADVDWHRWLGWVPLFRKRFHYCDHCWQERQARARKTLKPGDS